MDPDFFDEDWFASAFGSEYCDGYYCSVTAGYRAANLITLCSSAIRNDFYVYAYVKDVLDTLLQGSTDCNSLRRDVWAQPHPEYVR